MTIEEVLRQSTGYPINERIVKVICLERGLEANSEVTKEVLASEPFRLAQADVLGWVSNAPDLNENGVTISLNELERLALRRRANAIYKELDDPKHTSGIVRVYSYQGDDI